MEFFAKRKVAFKKAFACTLITVLLFSALDELYQLHVPGREASLGDVFLNILGFLAGVVAHRLASRRLKPLIRGTEQTHATDFHA
jgi:VanZ family protein